MPSSGPSGHLPPEGEDSVAFKGFSIWEKLSARPADEGIKNTNFRLHRAQEL